MHAMINRLMKPTMNIIEQTDLVIFTHRQHFRAVLKQQMADLTERNRAEFKARAQESQVAVEYDRQCKVTDLQEIVNKFNHMKHFRDDNKVVGLRNAHLKQII